MDNLFCEMDPLRAASDFLNVADELSEGNHWKPFLQHMAQAGFEEERYLQSTFPDRFYDTYSRWTKKPRNLSRRKRFIQLCKKLNDAFDGGGVLIALRHIRKKDPTSFTTFLFLLDHVKEGWFLTNLIAAINDCASQSLQQRLVLIQYGVIQKVFDRLVAISEADMPSRDGFIKCLIVGSMLYTTMKHPQTKNRIKEMKNYGLLKEKMETAILGNEVICDSVELQELQKMGKSLEEDFGDQSTLCSGCGKKEEEVLFKKCSRCKLAFFCSKSCFKASWKKHKHLCHPI